MDTQSIQKEITAAFPDHELSSPQFHFGFQLHEFGGANPKKSAPRRIRLLVSGEALDDHAACDRFGEILREAIVLMRLDGGAIIKNDRRGVLMLHEDDPHRSLFAPT